MPDQNQPASPSQPVTQPPVAPPPVSPPTTESRPNFVAFEETQPVTPPSPSPVVPTAPPVAPPPPPPPSSASVVTSGGGSKKKIFIIIGVVVLLLLVLAGILFVMQSSTSTPEPTATPESLTPTAYCSSITAYDVEGNTINTTALSNLQPGSTVRFAASGIATSGTFDKARFTINGVQRPEVTTKISGTDEFYDEFQIPEGVITFNVTAEVHMSETDTWY